MPHDDGFYPTRKRPAEYGNSPGRALLDEVGQFSRHNRNMRMKEMLGGGPEAQPEGMEGKEAPTLTPEECEACKAGVCDIPEHASPEDTEAMGKLVISIAPPKG